MLIARPNKSEIEAVKSDLKACFDMKELGDARRILGMDIRIDRKMGKLWLHQTDYIAKVLKRFNMMNVKETATLLSHGCKLSQDQKPKSEKERQEMSLMPYANVVGSIMYTMLCTRPDVEYAISMTSRYMSDYGKDHWNALKWTMRYLKGAGKCGILFGHTEVKEGAVLVGYCDADYAANVDNRRSQTGYIFTLYGATNSWKSNLQDVVALSTTEAEYMALTSAVKESFWLKGLANDFGVKQESVTVYCDNNSTICLAKHQVFHERSKHIDVRLHFIRDEIEKGKVNVVKISTDHNPTDMLTKALPREKFEYCKKIVNMF